VGRGVSPNVTDITVVIPTIPTRSKFLERALSSVRGQALMPVSVITESDRECQGAAKTRQSGLARVTTEWVAFLDDDDEFLPEHLAVCAQAAEEWRADFVYPWYRVVGGRDPMPQHFGKQWDPERPRLTTITVLVRTELAQDVGGFVGERPDLGVPGLTVSNEDWLFVNRINEAGGRIHHVPQRTWLWHHHGGNTSGLPAKVRATRTAVGAPNRTAELRERRRQRSRPAD
jgi:glycosyltransferase involved in cell wall biosynthesis